MMKNYNLRNVFSVIFLFASTLLWSQSFGCTSAMYLAQGPPTVLYSINTASNPFTYPPIGGNPGFSYNSIGLNPLDGFIYGIRGNQLIRIDASGTYTTLGVVSGLPVTASGYTSGEIDDSGNYYVKEGVLGNQLYKINLTTLTATLITLNANINVGDMCYNVVTGLLYGVNGGNGRLVSINPSTGTVVQIGIAPGAVQFGGMFGSNTGEVYGVNNNVGGFYQFNLLTGERTLISGAPASSGNDGAHCVTAPITFGAELSVTKTDGKTQYIQGTTNTYTIVAQNNGPFGVVNASVVDNVPAGIPAANVSYTAVASAGSSTGVVGTQTGAINDLVALPVGGTVTYTVTIAIPTNFSGDLVNTVSIASPVNSADPDLTNNTQTDTDTFGCYSAPNTGTAGFDTKYGITLLKRAGADSGNWPMIRKSAHAVLESNTKGFVITRMVSPETSITSPVEGMMVYDTDNLCLKIYDGTAWSCFTTPACP